MTRTVLEFEGERFVMTHPCLDCGKEIETGSLCESCVAERGADYDYYEEFESDDIEDFEDCSLMHDGQCMQAGTEYCDFECPNRESELFCGSTAWRKKHGED